MSATASTSSTSHEAFEWPKRKASTSEDYTTEAKRPRFNYYYTLASESSSYSDTGTESIYSVQGKETEYAKDTSDTDTKSELSDDFDLQVEYEVASESEEEQAFTDNSTGDSDILLAASAVVSTFVDEKSKEAWVTDDEKEENKDVNEDKADDTDSAASDLDPILKEIQKCWMCKIRITRNGFPLCSHCHQIRKTYFPPRPRKSKKTIDQPGTSSDTISQISQKSISSQDSGINLLGSGSSQTSCNSDEGIDTLKNNEAWSDWALAVNGMCIMCNEKPKNGIFLHTYGGHMCCCYQCAVKFWNKNKRCAYCNQKVKNVLRAFIV